MSPPDALDAERLRAAVGHQHIGHTLVFLEATTSTNDAVGQLEPSSCEGVVVFAEQQTAGRGQYGRRWESVAGKGLMFSILLRPRVSVGESARLTDFLARTLAAVINEELGLDPSIKPPNDVYVSGRKVAGVLVEMRVNAQGDYYAIAGIGINVNHVPTDFPPELQMTAGSLGCASGKPIDRTDLTIALLRRLDRDYAAAAL